MLLENEKGIFYIITASLYIIDLIIIMGLLFKYEPIKRFNNWLDKPKRKDYD